MGFLHRIGYRRKFRTCVFSRGFSHIIFLTLAETLCHFLFHIRFPSTFACPQSPLAMVLPGTNLLYLHCTFQLTNSCLQHALRHKQRFQSLLLSLDTSCWILATSGPAVGNTSFIQGVGFVGSTNHPTSSVLRILQLLMEQLLGPQFTSHSWKMLILKHYCTFIFT